MNKYWIVYFHGSYLIAKLHESFKNYDVFILLPQNTNQKLQASHKVYELKTNDIDVFTAEFKLLSTTIDQSLIYDLIEENTPYPIQSLAELYFGIEYTETQKTALLFSMANNLVDFAHKGDAVFYKNSEDARLTQKLNLEKAAATQKIIEGYYDLLIQLQSPHFEKDITYILNKSNRQSIEYKALSLAARKLNITVTDLAYKCGLITNVAALMLNNFMLDNFGSPIEYDNPHDIDISHIPLNLTIKTFSIDDESTTEIDDAFSVQFLADNSYKVGIHIAAPALEEHLADNICEHISTIYYPGNKITMLGDQIICKYSLNENKEVPVVSIYFHINDKFEIIDNESQLEIIKITKNLRVENFTNIENLDHNFGGEFGQELNLLSNFAQSLEKKRGKASVNILVPEYNFAFEANNTVEDEKIIITARKRGTPIDLIVSELMILANSTWGRMLTNAFIPAIYRVKSTNFPVKMTTTPGSHASLNVDYYTWATSPLRRSCDFINQHQIISLITDRKSYYRCDDSALVNVCEAFDSKYAKYLDFQNKMERYYSLKYLLQENINELDGTFFHRNQVQLSHVPITINTEGIINAKPKGSIIRIRIFNINPVSLTFEFKILSTAPDKS